jgi:hypothetical protein
MFPENYLLKFQHRKPAAPAPATGSRP